MIRTWEKRNRGGGEGRGEKLSRGAARGEERIYGRVVVVVRRSLNVGGAVVVEDDERRRRKVGRDVPSLVTWHPSRTSLLCQSLSPTRRCHSALTPHDVVRMDGWTGERGECGHRLDRRVKFGGGGNVNTGKNVMIID